jgi:hypothetical protein
MRRSRLPTSEAKRATTTATPSPFTIEATAPKTAISIATQSVKSTRRARTCSDVLGRCLPWCLPLSQKAVISRGVRVLAGPLRKPRKGGAARAGPSLPRRSARRPPCPGRFLFGVGPFLLVLSYVPAGGAPLTRSYTLCAISSFCFFEIFPSGPKPSTS